MTVATISERQIPDRIQSLAQWICWREDDRDGSPTKVPIKPYRTSGTPYASATDPDTWREFETALTYHRESTSRTDGVGFVFDPEAAIVGVDLDNCRDADSEEVAPWAADIIERLDSYTEVSPSGTGVHVLVEGTLPAGRNRRGDVEIYDRDRFFTVTGAHLDGTPPEIVRRQDALLAVHHEFVQTTGDETASTLTETLAQAGPADSRANHDTGDAGDGGADDESRPDDDGPTQPVGPNSGLRRKFGRDPPTVEDPALEAALHGLSPDEIPEPVPRTIDAVAGPGVDLSDSELVRRATASKRGETIQALLDGDSALWRGRDSRYPSQSEADLGLCFYLAFWTGGDPDRMDRLFRDSGLYREKWDRRHYGNGATYGAVTIARALLKTEDYYDPPSGSMTEPEMSAPEERPTPSVSQPLTDDESAVAHAQRLAAKIQQQERELVAQQERIHELETQVQWYRQFLGSLNVDPSEEESMTPTVTDVARSESAGSNATTADKTAGTPRVIERIRQWLS
jgi:primase-polymerase (primpol)-like protein